MGYDRRGHQKHQTVYLNRELAALAAVIDPHGPCPLVFRAQKGSSMALGRPMARSIRKEQKRARFCTCEVCGCLLTSRARHHILHGGEFRYASGYRRQTPSTALNKEKMNETCWICRECHRNLHNGGFPLVMEAEGGDAL